MKTGAEPLIIQGSPKTMKRRASARPPTAKRPKKSKKLLAIPPMFVSSDIGGGAGLPF
jgi:hypothetical protein